MNFNISAAFDMVHHETLISQLDCEFAVASSDLPTRVAVAGCNIKVLDRIKMPDVTLDASLTFESHINKVMRSCNFHRALEHQCQSLTRDLANTGLSSVSL